MLDLKFIRENAKLVEETIKNKNEKAEVREIIELDEKRRNLIKEAQTLKQKRNETSKEIGALKKEKKDASDKIQAMQEVSQRIKSIDEELGNIEDKIKNNLFYIPNPLHESVPIGKSEDDNKLVKEWGEKKEKIDKDHIQIGKELDILDFERAAKISGAGFAMYKNQGAALERALINFMLEYNVHQLGYKELMTPFIVNKNSMIGSGQIPKLEEDMYKVEKDEFYLIPTAEVPITNYFAGDTLSKEDLPTKFCGYSPCFRREAGSYGKETKGLLRIHQFNKVELVKFVEPENSYDELESMVEDVEKLLQLLELPYRILLLCSGDTSFSSAKTYDFEVWAPAEQKWLEVSSCSNFVDFQALRANIRYKESPNSKPRFVHTLNGSALATPRVMVALIENLLQKDGSIKLPDVLKDYCSFNQIAK